MATSRYTFIDRLGGVKLATSGVSSKIYFAAQNGNIRINTTRLTENQRLDHIAAKSYGDGALWWIIASASGIGWGLQCPAGTVIRIPTDLNQIYGLLR